MATHFVGIGGIGMSALAHHLLDLQAERVSGSDQSVGALAQALAARGATTYLGHRSDYVTDDCHRVIVGSAIPADHIECQTAQRRGIPIMHRSDLLAELMSQQEALLVAGTHGKTTTSALLAWVLFQAGWDPSWALGGCFQGQQMPHHGRAGQGLYFVAEADESDGTFLRYSARHAIVTNCDRDHLDHFKTDEALRRAFATFCAKLPQDGCLWCCDDPGLQAIQPRGVKYGRSSEADWRLDRVEATPSGLLFSVTGPHQVLQDLTLPLFGEHNALNATAVVALCARLGLLEEQLRRGLASFPGVQRRCHLECTTPFTVIHDYGHHPTEIQVTLEALRLRYAGKRLLVAFQPHRYTRTHDLMELFGPAFVHADHLIVSDIYAASEPPIPGVDGQSLCQAIARSLQEAKQHVPIDYVQTELLGESLKRLVGEGDVLVCFGAGSIDRIAQQIAAQALQHGSLSQVIGHE
jgi:UDP-N-acetylmuramate--alanine ligase